MRPPTLRRRHFVCAFLITGSALAGTLSGCRLFQPDDVDSIPPAIELRRLDGYSTLDPFDVVPMEVIASDPGHGRTVHVELAVDGTVIARKHGQGIVVLQVDVDLGEHWRWHKQNVPIQARAHIAPDLVTETTTNIVVNRVGFPTNAPALEVPADGDVLVGTWQRPVWFEAEYPSGPYELELQIRSATDDGLVTTLFMDRASPWRVVADGLAPGDYTASVRWNAQQDSVVHVGPLSDPHAFTLIPSGISPESAASSIDPLLPVLSARRSPAGDGIVLRRLDRFTIHSRSLEHLGSLPAPSEDIDAWTIDASGRVVVARYMDRGEIRVWREQEEAFDPGVSTTDHYAFRTERVTDIAALDQFRVAVGLDANRESNLTVHLIVLDVDGMPVWYQRERAGVVIDLEYDAAREALYCLEAVGRSPRVTRLRRLDPSNGDAYWSLEISGPRGLTLEPSGHLLIMTSAGFTRVDPEGATREDVAFEGAPGPVSSAFFSPDGRAYILSSVSGYSESTTWVSSLDASRAVIRSRRLYGDFGVSGIGIDDGVLLVGRMGSDWDRTTPAVVVRLWGENLNSSSLR